MPVAALVGQTHMQYSLHFNPDGDRKLLLVYKLQQG